MPSRVIHLAAVERLLAGLPALLRAHPSAHALISRITGSERGRCRLRLGSVLSDSAPKHAGHLVIRFSDPVSGRMKKTYDLTGFRERFGDLLLTDGLYLGYYLHLVGDIVQRGMLYGETGYDPRVPENVARLHRDYEALNPYVIETYGLQAPPTLRSAGIREVPHGSLEDEALFSLAPFRAAEFLEDMRRDFAPRQTAREACVFFTPAMTDEFVRRAVLASEREILALLYPYGGARQAYVPLDELAAAWDTSGARPGA